MRTSVMGGRTNGFSAFLRAHVERRLFAALGRVGDRVRAATVEYRNHLDVDADRRWGVLLRLRPSRRSEMAIEESGADLGTTIDRVAAKARRALQRARRSGGRRRAGPFRLRPGARRAA